MATKDGKHYLDSELINRRVRITVVGAGGTGSHVVSDLAVLHQSMLDLGHPGGLSVQVMDFDDVTSANVGRARFYESDVGLNKAQVLVNRINLCYGFDFKASSRALDQYTSLERTDIVIGCVDTRQSRREIWEAGFGQRGYWLDMGNGADDGQLVLGEFPHQSRVGATKVEKTRLPCVVELYPEMLNPVLDPKDAGPSCSRAEALRKQSAFINKTAALHGVSILANLFRDGFIAHHGVFFNTRTGRSNTLACDPAVWKRFGFDATADQALAESVQ